MYLLGLINIKDRNPLATLIILQESKDPRPAAHYDMLHKTQPSKFILTFVSLDRYPRHYRALIFKSFISAVPIAFTAITFTVRLSISPPLLLCRSLQLKQPQSIFASLIASLSWIEWASQIWDCEFRNSHSEYLYALCLWYNKCKCSGLSDFLFFLF